MTLDEGTDVLLAVTHATANVHERQIGTPAHPPGGERGRLNLQECGGFVFGQQRTGCADPAVMTVYSHRASLPFIERRLSASMSVSVERGNG
jgi:hypothetical protein